MTRGEGWNSAVDLNGTSARRSIRSTQRMRSVVLSSRKPPALRNSEADFVADHRRPGSRDRPIDPKCASWPEPRRHSTSDALANSAPSIPDARVVERWGPAYRSLNGKGRLSELRDSSTSRPARGPTVPGRVAQRRSGFSRPHRGRVLHSRKCRHFAGGFHPHRFLGDPFRVGHLRDVPDRPFDLGYLRGVALSCRMPSPIRSGTNIGSPAHLPAHIHGHLFPFGRVAHHLHISRRTRRVGRVVKARPRFRCCGQPPGYIEPDRWSQSRRNRPRAPARPPGWRRTALIIVPPEVRLEGDFLLFEVFADFGKQTLHCRNSMTVLGSSGTLSASRRRRLARRIARSWVLNRLS